MDTILDSVTSNKSKRDNWQQTGRTTRFTGDLQQYNPAQLDYEDEPYVDRRAYFMDLFGKVNPAPVDDADKEARLQRVAKLQALGNLFKNLGEFAGGRGYAPVERQQDNGRLWQTLGQSEAERERRRGLEEQYRQSQLSWVDRRMAEDMAAQEKKNQRKYNQALENIRAENEKNKFNASEYNRYRDKEESMTRENLPIESTSTSARSVNVDAAGNRVGGGGGGGSMKQINFSDGTTYNVSKSFYDSLPAVLMDLGYLKKVPSVVKNPNILDIKNPTITVYKWDTSPRAIEDALNRFRRDALLGKNENIVSVWDTIYKVLKSGAATRWDNVFENNPSVSSSFHGGNRLNFEEEEEYEF